MQKVTRGLMVAGLLLCSAAISRAEGPCGGCGAPCGYEVVWVKKTITVCEARLETREETRQVCRLVPETVEKVHTCTVLVPNYTTATRTVVCYHTEMQQQQREVCVCRRVPVCVTDPCTGCTYT